MLKKVLSIILSIWIYFPAIAQRPGNYNGINTNLGNLQKLSNAKSRSISPENFTGGKGMGGRAELSDSIYPHKALAANAAKELGRGWKLNPAVKMAAGEIFTLAEIDGSGAIQHILLTPGFSWNSGIFRIYWDDEKEPSVESPVGNFFCMGLNEYSLVNSLPVSVFPKNGFNSFWTMPFRKKCKITIETKVPGLSSFFIRLIMC